MADLLEDVEYSVPWAYSEFVDEVSDAIRRLVQALNAEKNKATDADDAYRFGQLVYQIRKSRLVLEVD